ncbi:hypothetical protein ACFOZ1_10960 [Gracilibacillus marinus]|uniref:ABC-2 family transporter protein n=1 Tax=Gracilibacillus marinus TaxID=630535 RepID=A0ABV8VXE8_9BACI
MKSLIKAEIQKLKYPYLISIFIAAIYSVLVIISVLHGYSYTYNIEVWEESGELFRIIFPIFAVLPTTWLMFYERKNGFLSYTITRVSKKKYIILKWLVSSIGGAFIVFIISFLGLIVCLYFIPDVVSQGTDSAIDKFAGDFFVNHPFIYGFLLSIWRLFIGFLIASLGFVISLYVNNIFIVLTGPFVYAILENFSLSILGAPYYRLVTSFDPNTLQETAISIERLIVGPLFLIVFTSGIITYFALIKKENIYEL